MLRDIIMSFSFANICLANIWAKFFFKQQFYIKEFPKTNSFIALIILELAFTIIIWLGLNFVRRLNKPLILKIATVYVSLSVLYLIQLMVTSPLGNSARKPMEIFMASALIFLLFKPKLFKKFATISLQILAPFAILICSQAVLGIINDLNSKPVISQQLPFFAREASSPRVLWLIYDEMDQRLAFSERPEGVQLSNFDRFKQEAFFAQNAYAPAMPTIPSMPSLIDGKTYTDFQVKGSDELLLGTAGVDDFIRWGSQPNVFSEARKLKVNTALVGEYIPYPRILGKDLNYGTWDPYRHDFVDSNDTILGNIGAQLYGFFAISRVNLYYQSKKAYSNEQIDAKKLSIDPKYGLIMIHFAIPHEPGIYNQQWWNVSPKGYLKNLEYADQGFGEIRKQMEEHGMWENTTVLISSDHNYRKSKKIDGKKDRRIPFILKLAGQKQSIIYEPSFNTVLSKDLILAILRQEVNTPSEVTKWIDLNHGSN